MDVEGTAQGPARAGDEWVRHVAALRALAAALVGDEHEAEDLVQETWLRSRRAGERQGGRAWLRAVLRNLARDRARRAEARRRSEREAAREEALPSEAEVLERLDVAQRVAGEVARLAEPYRTALHLRYFEGLAPEELARRAGVPLETARTRLRRGLALLRERLDRAHGERRAWALALGPLASLPRGAGATTTTTGAALAGAGGLLMSAKPLVAGAVLLLSALGVFLVTRRPAADPPTRPELAPAGASLAELAAPLPAPTDQARDAEPAREPLAAPATTPAPAAPRAAAPVDGLVIVTDEHGVEHARESGSLLLAVGTGEADAVTREVPVADGRWTTELAPGQWLVAARLVAGGRAAALPEPRPVTPGTEPVVVRGEWLPRGRLRVVGAVSGADLPEVEVRCAEGWRANPEWTHPGDDPRVRTVARGASPLELPERLWTTPYWVHAPGHAWARVDFDHRVGGQRTVALSPSPAAVVVRAAGAPPGAVARLYPSTDGGAMEGAMEDATEELQARVGAAFGAPADPLERPDWTAAVCVRLDEAGAARIDDLEPGDFAVTVELGEHEERVHLGLAQVRVGPGETATVDVPVDPARLGGPRPRLSGTVRLPAGFDRADCALWLQRTEEGEREFRQALDEMAAVPGDPDLLRWDAGPMRPGDYLAYFTGIQHRELVHAPGPGDTEVELVVPALARVRVEVVDLASGAPVEPQRLQWCDGPLAEVDGNYLLDVPAGAEGYSFVAPLGPVEVRAEARGYLAAQVRLELTRPETSCRVELARATAVHLVLREDGAALDPGWGFLDDVRVTRADGAPVRSTGSRASDVDWTLFLEEGGSYRLELPPLAGYEPFEPLEVDVAPGETTELVVEAVRLP